MFNWLRENWSIIVRWGIYVSIAVLTTVIAETGTSSLPAVWAIGIKATLQGIIAWRAFLDESMAWAKINKKK